MQSLKINQISSQKLIRIIFSLGFIVGVILILSSFSFAHAQDVVDNSGQAVELVKCGTTANPDPCRIDDLISTMGRVAVFIITIILPVVFFYGLFMTILPLIKSPDNPVSRAEAKSRFIKLLIGTAVVAGAYIIVKGALIAIGVNQTESLQKVINTDTTQSYNYLQFVDSAYAQTTDCAEEDKNPLTDVCNTPVKKTTTNGTGATSDSVSSEGGFKNPLASTSVQEILNGIINAVTFIAILGNIYMYFRSGFLFLNSQQKPEGLKSAKVWLVWAIGVSLIIFGAQTIYSIVEGTIKSVFTT